MNMADIEIGMTVIYLPPHAKGNLAHPDREEGRVTSLRGDRVFVCFAGETSAACSPKNLRDGSGKMHQGGEN